MIHRFKKILLVARGRSEERAAVNAAARLAKENEAELTALRVLQRVPRDASTRALLPTADLERVATGAAEADLRGILDPAMTPGAHWRVKVAFGTPFIEVIREVVVNKFDLVVLNADSSRSLRRSLFGSMTMRLIRKCPCPIWVVRSEHTSSQTRVLAAVGPPHDSEDEGHLNRKIVELAASVAKLEQGELHVVHAWDVFAEGILAGRAGVPEDDIRKMAREARKQAKKLIRDLVAPVGLADHQERIHLTKGSPAVAIPRLVRRKKIDVLVMGTVCRTGVAGFLMGNTAERVLREVHCSVVTLKPDGFVSPVTVD